MSSSAYSMAQTAAPCSAVCARQLTYLFLH